MSAATLAIVGDLVGDRDRWARSICGLVDAGTLFAHVTQAIGVDSLPRWCDAVLAVGRDTAARFGMPHPGFGDVGVGTQWREPAAGPLHSVAGPGLFCTFVPAIGARPHPALIQSIRRAVIGELVLGSPSLRAWHFRIADITVLQDLGAALCPLAPTLGMAFAHYSAETHRSRAAAVASAPSKAIARLGGDIVATFKRGEPPCCVDTLRTIASTIRADDGAADLCRAWGVSQAAIKASAATMPDYQDHSAQRATALRYALAGL